jgi:hypothetical protein
LAAVAGAEITIGATPPTVNPNANRAALLERQTDKPDMKNNLFKTELFYITKILGFHDLQALDLRVSQTKWIE